MHSHADSADRQVGIWLLVCCAVLFSLIVLGAATRLTGSGLSIVHWQPITGVWPPIGEQQWQQVFDQYRDSPEYQHVNRGMSLSEFKVIFFYEYAHRLLARTLGLLFAVPLAWFWWRGRLAPWLRWPMIGLLLLGLAQGYMGWYMVKSGLVDEPRVSQYRLTAHLSLALAIYVGMFWLALRLLWPRVRNAAAAAQGPLLAGTGAMLALLAVTIISGAFVAGLKAGYLYNTFPLMAGRWIPTGFMYLEPAWRNFFENPATVQFMHRVLGVGTVLAATGLWFWSRRVPLERAQRWGFTALAAFAYVQMTLGISTLLLYMPVWLAATHQAGAVVLLSIGLTALHLMHVSRVSSSQPSATRLSMA
jgi:heme a synthase